MEETTKTEIVIIDDHTLFRETMEGMVNTYKEYHVVGSFDNLPHAIEWMKPGIPYVVLLDICMPVVNGLDGVKILRKEFPLARIIAVSMYVQPAIVKQIVRNGALGYLTKNSRLAEIKEALDEITAGRKFSCKEIKNIVANDIINETAELPTAELSTRELEIIEMIWNGLSSKMIGSKLLISTKTVEVHRHNILKKLQVKNSISLIKYINQHPGLFPFF